MAANPNTDFVAGAILTASQQNRFGRGVMGYALGTTSSGFTGITDVTGMSITFTAVANRLYKATFSGSIDQNTTAAITVYLTDGSNNIQAQYGNYGTGSTQNTHTFSYLFTASAGSVTRKIRASVGAGGATVLYGAGSWAYGFIIEDMGPA